MTGDDARFAACHKRPAAALESDSTLNIYVRYRTFFEEYFNVQLVNW